MSIKKVQLDKPMSFEQMSIDTQNPEIKEEPKIKYDKMKMYFKYPHAVKCGNVELNIIQPTIGDILEFGEQEFFKTFRTFITNTTENRVMLWEGIPIGIKDGQLIKEKRNWNKMSDFELFILLLPSADQRVVDMLFDDFQINQLRPVKIEDKLFLIDKNFINGETGAININFVNDGIVIDEETYEHIADYMRTMFNMFPKEEKIKGKVAQRIVIEHDKSKLKRAEKEGNSSFLLPAISFYKCHPGTSCTIEQLKDLGIFEFMYDLKRLQIYEQSRAVMSGMYSGFVDGKKIKPDDYNMMRDF